MHPLDNVIWEALTTRQTNFAEGSDGARKFIREVSPLAALSVTGPPGYAALANLLEPRGSAGIFLDEPYQPQPDWTYVAGAPLVQMVLQSGTAAECSAAGAQDIIEVGSNDSPEMLELTTLTKPGPFGTRTHELGSYIGIRCEGKLVAMAGERLKVPGFTEISAVCTHPGHTGKGYGAALMIEMMQGIRKREETPFLHVRQDNPRAIALYERLGFRERKLGHFAVLRYTPTQ